jgi:hypothetical protein
VKRETELEIGIVVIGVLGLLASLFFMIALTGGVHAATLVESYNPNQCTVEIRHYKPGVGGKLTIHCTCRNPVVTLSPPVNGSQTLTVSCPKGKK